MYCIHCTLSTTQHSGECEDQRTYPTHSNWWHAWDNKLICALEASKFSGLGMISQEIWTENANLGSILQLSLDVHLCVQTSSLTAKFGIKQTCKHDKY